MTVEVNKAKKLVKDFRKGKADRQKLVKSRQSEFVELAKRCRVDINYFEVGNMIHVYPLFASFGSKETKNFFEKIRETHSGLYKQRLNEVRVIMKRHWLDKQL